MTMIGKPQIAMAIALLVTIAIASIASAEQRCASRALVVNQNQRYIAQRAESGGTGEGAWQILRRPMDLPDLPKYTGQQPEFVEGLIYPNKTGGAAISMNYRAKETPEVVLQWYVDALKNFQWKLDPMPRDEHTAVRATHGKNGISVNVSPANKTKGFRTDIRISFKLSSK
ncbi:MAG: hypothetical protein K2X93_04340 [Candidatus Obscuribacterales bacterium]|nr:hypothetical protein [Candidatus Obscuribacterales bacterium]